MNWEYETEPPKWSSKRGKKPKGWPDFDIHLGCPSWPHCPLESGCLHPNPWDWVEDKEPGR